MVEKLSVSDGQEASEVFNMFGQSQAHGSDSDLSSTRQSTPSSTATGSQSPISLPPDAEYDAIEFNPDIPISSIEGRDTPTPSSSTPSTPSASHPAEFSTPPYRLGSSDMNDRLANFRFSFQSPVQKDVISAASTPTTRERTSSSSSTPSVRVTPSPSSGTTRQTPSNSGASTPRPSRQSSGLDGIMDGINAIDISMRTLSPQTPYTADRSQTRSQTPENRLVDGENTSRRRSASRRRSTSQMNVPCHVVAHEDPPDALLQARGIQTALADTRNATIELVDLLSSSALHREPGSTIQRLHQDAIRLSEFRPPSQRIVGLVGDSGVGKSSLINSLLDNKDLARTSNSGAACTCVVTEYRYHHSQEFTIEVEFFTIDELGRQFAELLTAYRQFHLREDGISPEERKDLKDRATLAEYTFQAAFRDQIGQDERVLHDRPEAAMLTHMTEWASQRIRQWSGSGGLEMKETLASADACSGRLEELTSERDETLASADACSGRLEELTSERDETRGASIWPFIRRIKVHLDAWVLSKGLIIVDLPGLRDLNAARQNVTERYIRSCDEILAVCYIGRATTDKGVEEVFRLGRRADLSNIGIICTKSDDIQAAEAERDWPEERADIRRKRELVDDDRQLMSDIEQDINTLQTQFGPDRAPSEEDTRDLNDMRREYLSTKTLFDQHEFQLKNHLINVRNRKVASQLRSHYSDRVPNHNLTVFCISNTIYWQHRLEAASASLPFLRLSGVLELRRHCISIIAQSHLRATTEYVKDSVPALLGSVELWVKSGAGNMDAERKQAVQNTVENIQNQLRRLSLSTSQPNDLARSIEQRFRIEVAQHLRQRAVEWSGAAGNASLQWQGWHHATYSAFCRNYGNYSTKAVGSHCWNDQAIAPVVAYTTTKWQSFVREVESLHNQLLEAIKCRFESASEPVASANDNDALNTLAATLCHQKNIVVAEIEQACERFEDDLSTLQTDAFSDIRSSIIGQLLEDSYHACNIECGGGSDARRKTIIRTRFHDVQLFHEHRRQIVDKLATRARGLQDIVLEKIGTRVRAIENDLDTLRNENAVLESERFPEFRTRLADEVARIGPELRDAGRRVNEVMNAAGQEDETMTG